MRTVRIVPALVALALSYPHLALASGNLLPRAPADALGVADANVALSNGASSQITNPANMVHGATGDGTWEIAGGAAFGDVKGTYKRPTTLGPARAGSYDTEDNKPVLPFAGMSYRITPATSIGLSYEVAHGLSIEWPKGTYAVQLLTPSDLQREADLSATRLGVAVATTLDPKWSLGGRVFYQQVDVTDKNGLYHANGDGDSWGYQIGLSFRDTHYAAGIAYTSRTRTDIDGKLKDINPALTGVLVAGDASTTIKLPDRLQVGAAFRLLENVWWEVDLDWLGWSYYDELAIKQSNGTLANSQTYERHSNNTTSIRTGVQWQYSPTVVLRAGLGYDPTPIPEEDASPTTNMLRKMRYAVGAGFTTGKSTRIDVAYQYIDGRERKIDHTDLDTLGVDRQVYNGKYSSETQILGISVVTQF